MAKTRVVNIYKEPKYDVYIGRAGHGQDGYFGNPFALGVNTTRDDVLIKYADYFIDRWNTDPEFKRRVMDLQGKTLGCFCKPKTCHGDVIVTWIDAEAGEEELPWA